MWAHFTRRATVLGKTLAEPGLDKPLDPAVRKRMAAEVAKKNQPAREAPAREKAECTERVRLAAEEMAREGAKKNDS
jgi:hypothetical protein